MSVPQYATISDVINDAPRRAAVQSAAVARGRERYLDLMLGKVEPRTDYERALARRGARLRRLHEEAGL